MTHQDWPPIEPSYVEKWPRGPKLRQRQALVEWSRDERNMGIFDTKIYRMKTFLAGAKSCFPDMSETSSFGKTNGTENKNVK